MLRVAALIVVVTAAAAILVAGRRVPAPVESRNDAVGYPPPPAGPTQQSEFSGKSVEAVARSILSVWQRRGLASDDVSIISAMSVTEADAACFGIGQGIISAGDPIDVAVLIAGTAIRSDMPSMNDAASPYGLLIVDREIGLPFAQMRAPTLDVLEKQMDCASTN